MAPVRIQRQSPWWISPVPMLPFFHHPMPLPIQLACSKTLPSDTLLWQTERQRERKDLSISLFSFPSVSACILRLKPPWPSQQTLPIPRLLPPKETPQFWFPKTFHWQFLPSSFQHSLCVTVSSLPSYMAGRRVLLLLILSLGNPDLNHVCRTFNEHTRVYICWQADQLCFPPQEHVSETYDVCASYMYLYS